MTPERASRPTLLIVSRAPVPGRAKTRLANTVGDLAAAELAGAAILDTIAAAEASGLPIVIAMAGDLTESPMHDDIAEAIRPYEVIGQRGDGLAERLANAHADADRGAGVVQIGMDTPHADPDVLLGAAQLLSAEHDAALGMATDGGWWLLAVRRSGSAGCLLEVPMSTEETGILTRTALARAGCKVAPVSSLTDVDTWADALVVAASAPDTLFARRMRSIRHDRHQPA